MTLDDLHDDEIQALVATAPRSTFFDDGLLDARRASVQRFDQQTVPLLRDALRVTDHLSGRQPKRKQRDALATVYLALEAVLDKIGAEDTTELEQFGPLKRFLNREVLGTDDTDELLRMRATAYRLLSEPDD
ncbi:MAG: hypothetical protein ACTHMQ_03685 [Protaetiibacter sp.]